MSRVAELKEMRCREKGKKKERARSRRTVLAANIHTLEQQQRAVANADLVRPGCCPTCQVGRMHVHDYRTRKPRGDEDWPPVIDTLRLRCADCRAVWLVLPAFLGKGEDLLAILDAEARRDEPQRGGR